MYKDQNVTESPLNAALIRLLISSIDVSSKSPRHCPFHLRTFTAVWGAITDDRNANSATKGRDVTRLRQERHAIERNGTHNRWTLTTSINKIYDVRGDPAPPFPSDRSSAMSGSSQRARKRHRVCSWAAPSSPPRGKAGQRRKLLVFVCLLQATGKNPREETH